LFRYLFGLYLDRESIRHEKITIRTNNDNKNVMQVGWIKMLTLVAILPSVSRIFPVNYIFNQVSTIQRAAKSSSRLDNNMVFVYKKGLIRLSFHQRILKLINCRQQLIDLVYRQSCDRLLICVYLITY
jgi:hypothetical protein